MTRYKIIIAAVLLSVGATEAMEERDPHNADINDPHRALITEFPDAITIPPSSREETKNRKEKFCSLNEINSLSCKIYRIFQEINTESQEFFLTNIYKIFNETSNEAQSLNFPNFAKHLCATYNKWVEQPYYRSKVQQDVTCLSSDAIFEENIRILSSALFKEIAVQIMGDFTISLNEFIKKTFLTHFAQDRNLTLFHPKNSPLQVKLNNIAKELLKIIQARLGAIENDINRLRIIAQKNSSMWSKNHPKLHNFQKKINRNKEKLYEDLKCNLPKWMNTYIFTFEVYEDCLRKQIPYQEALLESELNNITKKTDIECERYSRKSKELQDKVESLEKHRIRNNEQLQRTNNKIKSKKKEIKRLNNTINDLRNFINDQQIEIAEKSKALDNYLQNNQYQLDNRLKMQEEMFETLLEEQKSAQINTIKSLQKEEQQLHEFLISAKLENENLRKKIIELKEYIAQLESNQKFLEKEISTIRENSITSTFQFSQKLIEKDDLVSVSSLEKYSLSLKLILRHYLKMENTRDLDILSLLETIHEHSLLI